MSLAFWRRKAKSAEHEGLTQELAEAKCEISKLQSAHDLARNRLDLMIAATIVEHPHCLWCGAPLNRNSVNSGTGFCSRKHVRSHENRQDHLVMVPLRTCPRPEKLAISYRGTAMRHAIIQGQFFYECRCGVFHLTSASNESASALAAFRGEKLTAKS